MYHHQTPASRNAAGAVTTKESRQPTLDSFAAPGNFFMRQRVGVGQAKAPKLLERPRVLALTKCDLVEGGVAGVDPELLKIHSRVFPISSLSKEGLQPLLHEMLRLLHAD